jgi:hypothetical protein
MIVRVLCFLLLASSTLASKDIGKVIDDLFVNYDKRVHPNNGEKQLDVAVEAAILDVYNFDELNHQVTLVMYFRQKWTDPRLKFDTDQVNGVASVLLDPEQAKKLWIPDTFIANERSVVQHQFSGPNEFTRVLNNGSVTRSVKLTVTVGCILNLRWFPFDQNVCSLNFESYAYSLNDVRYLWGKDGGGKPKIWISKETAQSVRYQITAFRGTESQETLASGNSYCQVGLELSFKRLSFRYFLDVYFPATAIPIIAFITLVVGPLHFRVMMSTICMATMIVYASILMTLTPKVDYKTALDFYVFNSSVTAFNVVLVNFLMYYLLKPKPTPTQIRMRQLNGSSEDGKGILAEEDISEETGNASGSANATATPRFPSKKHEVLYKLCEKSYLTVPLFFVIFNIIYWTVVLIASSGTPENFTLVENPLDN